MTRLTYKDNGSKFNSNYLKFGNDGLLYMFENYLIVFDENNLNMCYLAVSDSFKKCLLLSGSCELNIIRGSLNINGVNFLSPYKENIYSPLSHSKLTFQIRKYDNFCTLDELIIILVNNDNEAEQSLKNLFNENNPQCYKAKWNLMKLTSLSRQTLDDIVQFKEFRKLFDVDLDFPFAKKMKFSLTHQENPDYFITEEMKKSLTNVIEFATKSNDLKIVLVGPKNSGKSSFLKTVTNELFVNGFKEIYILDGDPGQSEFSPCGSLSLTLVSQPLLGPPFTHQFSNKINVVEQYFLGLLSPNDDPKLYCRSFERLYQKYLSICTTHPAPLIINTMGWVVDIGLLLLTFKLLLVNPSHIIQLKKGKPNQDLVDITPEFLEKCTNESCLLTNLNRKITSEIMILKSPVSHNQQSELQLNPQNHRELTILTYLFHQTENRPLCILNSLLSDYSSNPVTRLRCRNPVTMKFRHFHNNSPPANQDIDEVYLKMIGSETRDLNQLDFILECFQMQFVAICRPAEPSFYQSIIKESPYANCKQNELELMCCFGMCLVSCIRKNTNEIDLLTDIDRSILKGCCLVKGKIFPPETLFLNQREIMIKQNNISLPFISPQIPVGVGRTAIPTRKSLPKVRRHQHN